MILLCGIPSEGPLARVSAEVTALGLPLVVLNQRRFAEWDLAFDVNDDGISGWLAYDNRTYSLADITGVYVRLIDDRDLPEFKVATSIVRAHCRGRHETLTRWLEITPARVLNRAASMASNFSKPFQAQLIAAAGFDLPPSLITNDLEMVNEFRRKHGRVIFKSISSVRSIVRELTDADLTRLDRIRWCPVQFQALIQGVNVRVHVVGDQIFATEIGSDAVDYRYAQNETGESAELRAIELPTELGNRCRVLAHSLGLPLAGIDLKRTADGQVICFEVNPSPGFTYYESNTGQPIARAIAEYLAGG
jgi:glutathione synthase/RimK-type ligase-like ATP-grasp enzyme